MGSIHSRPETKKLYFDFRYRSKRCREQTALDDTPANRRKLKKVLEKIEAEMTLGSFEYARYFPNSPLAEEMSRVVRQGSYTKTPLFEDFADTWLSEMKIQWRDSHYETVSHTFKKYLNPHHAPVAQPDRVSPSEGAPFSVFSISYNLLFSAFLPILLTTRDSYQPFWLMIIFYWALA